MAQVKDIKVLTPLKIPRAYFNGLGIVLLHSSDGDFIFTFIAHLFKRETSQWNTAAKLEEFKKEAVSA